jgi:hypothetical protein
MKKLPAEARARLPAPVANKRRDGGGQKTLKAFYIKDSTFTLLLYFHVTC